jgi:outer membrane lipoprotein carrier protein
MIRRAMVMMFALTVTSSAIANAQATPPNGTVIAQNASKRYLALSSFRANFKQSFDDAVKIEESTGILYQEGKNHLAMRWNDPPKDAIVLDGEYLWIYLPSTSPGQVIRYPQQNHPTYGSNVIGTFLENPETKYRITYVSSEKIDGNLTDAVMMEPIAKDPNFLRATLWLDRQLGMPRRIEIQEKRNHKRILDLSSLIMNPSIPPSIFKFDAKGLKVIPGQ